MKIIAGKKQKFEHDLMLVDDGKVLMQVNFPDSAYKERKLGNSERKIIREYLKIAAEEINTLRISET